MCSFVRHELKLLVNGYLNGERVPRQRFRRLMEDMRTEFLKPPRPAPSRPPRRSVAAAVWHGFKAMIQSAFRLVGYEIRRLPASSPVPGQSPVARRRGLKLYVGCGEDSRPGYVGCDVRSTPAIAIVCKAWEVSKHCADVEEIYSRHMLEHLAFPELEATFADWMRALAVGGRVHVIVPNMDYHIEQWLRADWNEATWQEKWSDARHAFHSIWGWQRETDPLAREPAKGSAANPYWDVHKSGFNAKSLEFFLRRAGFENVRTEILDDWHLVAKGYKPQEQPARSPGTPP